ELHLACNYVTIAIQSISAAIECYNGDDIGAETSKTGTTAMGIEIIVSTKKEFGTKEKVFSPSFVSDGWLPGSLDNNKRPTCSSPLELVYRDVRGY
ncbi:hypothetical protein NPIL_682791, partial [Nephila pilipes]